MDTEVKKLLVMSDSHGDRDVVEEIKKRYQETVAAIFHNGDSEIAADDPVWSGVYVVQGNCDWGERYPERLITEVAGLRIAQTHGHLYGINYSWQGLDYWAQEVEADICLYGHLHVPDVAVRGGILFLNPGSISQPRGLVQECLYAIVTVTEEKFLIDFFNRNHECYTALSTGITR